uniref:MOB kinase activator-like 2 n=1 Tax=Petromyzon marinus TaxID=7757 RepID=A0AAJ7SL70_PETMA|nr:MOB kinase activator-like 2 [Petromyzon marinus]
MRNSTPSGGCCLLGPTARRATLHRSTNTTGTTTATTHHHHHTACDDYYRSDEHSEAVQAALARQRERRSGVPMPSKRHSLVAQMSVDTYTPPDTSSASDDDGSLCTARLWTAKMVAGGGVSGGVVGGATPSSASPCSLSVERWISRAVRRSSTSSSSASSSSSHSAGRLGRPALRELRLHAGPRRSNRPAGRGRHPHHHRHHHLHHHQYQQQLHQLHQLHQHHQHHQQQQQHWPTGDGARLSVSHGALACLGGPVGPTGRGAATGGAGEEAAWRRLAAAPGPGARRRLQRRGPRRRRGGPLAIRVAGPIDRCGPPAAAASDIDRGREGATGLPPDVNERRGERHPPGRPPHAKRSHVASVRGLPRRLGNVELMETGRRSSSWWRPSSGPKRPPLKEFFVDDSERAPGRYRENSTHARR